ncbi:hypothetical protein D9M70_422640 [compost metagenome]
MRLRQGHTEIADEEDRGPGHLAPGDRIGGDDQIVWHEHLGEWAQDGQAVSRQKRAHLEAGEAEARENDHGCRSAGDGPKQFVVQHDQQNGQCADHEIRPDPPRGGLATLLRR